MMKMQAIKLGPKTTCINWNDAQDGLDRMYKEIGCRVVEFIDLPKLSGIVFPESKDMLTMVCDEEGRLTDRPEYNAKATALFRHEFPYHDIFLAGKALLLKVDSEGNTKALDDSEVWRVKWFLNLKDVRDFVHRVIIKLSLYGENVF